MMCGQREFSDFLDVPSLIGNLTKVIGKVSLLYCGDSKIGGRFALLSIKKGTPPVIDTKIGILSDANNKLFQRLALGNAEWMQDNPVYPTSYDGRFNQKDFHPAIQSDSSIVPSGGAVRGNSYIFSFSGFPELWNEAAMLATANYFSQLSEKDGLDRFSSVRNPHLQPLLEVLS